MEPRHPMRTRLLRLAGLVLLPAALLWILPLGASRAQAPADGASPASKPPARARPPANSPEAAETAPTDTKAPPPRVRDCPKPRRGRYLILVRGRVRAVPVLRLLQETWKGDGSLRGALMERRGRRYRRVTYDSSWKEVISCAASVERRLPRPGPPPSQFTPSRPTPPSQPSGLVIGPNGLPRYGIDVSPGSVITERWMHQPAGPCTATRFNGVMLGRQHGQMWRGEGWAANARIQRETWQNGAVVGLAVASLASKGEVLACRGQVSLEESCLGSMRHQDAKGRIVTAAGVARSDGKGYATLQNQPDQLSLALFDRVGPLAARPSP